MSSPKVALSDGYKFSSRPRELFPWAIQVEELALSNNSPRVWLQDGGTPWGQPKSETTHVAIPAVEISTRKTCAGSPTRSAKEDQPPAVSLVK